jgi:hypothetical protein
VQRGPDLRQESNDSLLCLDPEFLEFVDWSQTLDAELPGTSDLDLAFTGLGGIFAGSGGQTSSVALHDGFHTQNSTPASFLPSTRADAEQSLAPNVHIQILQGIPGEHSQAEFGDVSIARNFSISDIVDGAPPPIPPGEENTREMQSPLSVSDPDIVHFNNSFSSFLLDTNVSSLRPPVSASTPYSTQLVSDQSSSRTSETAASQSITSRSDPPRPVSAAVPLQCDQCDCRFATLSRLQ